MLYNKLSRRHFLSGMGGSFLALPFLPSLMSKAEAATLSNPKFLVMYWNGHGGLNVQNMYPILTNPTVAGNLQQQSLYSAQNHNMLIGKLTSLRTTRASNLPYLGTNLDQNAGGGYGPPPTSTSYSLDPSGNDFDAGAARVTPIIGSFASDALLNKMNLICGLDLMYGSGHTNAQTGNFCNYNGNSPTSPSANGFTNVWVPSIDAVAASYAGFYGTNTPVAPSVVLNSTYGNSEDFSGNLSCFNSPSGIVGNGNTPGSLGAAFSLLFGGLVGTSNPSGANAETKRTFILNKVHADYVRVARGAYGPGRRIGKDDRTRFEEFIANVQSIITGVTPYGVCSIPNISPSDQSQVSTGAINAASTQTTLHLYNQMMAASFNCGLTQSFLFALPSLVDGFVPSGSPNPTFTDGTTGPDTHQALFHMHEYADRQTMLVHSQRFYFQYAFYDLMQQLDAISSPSGSGTLLDQALLFWTHECGFMTHNGNALPMISAGGAGGFLKTGNFVDYRNASRPLMLYGLQGHVGVPYNRFLATALQALGVPPSAYELKASLFAGTTGRIPVSSLGTVPGYGHPYQTTYSIDSTNNQVYPYDYQLNDMSTPLPGIT